MRGVVLSLAVAAVLALALPTTSRAATPTGNVLRPVGDQAVDTPLEQPSSILHVVDRPDLDAQTRAVRIRDKTRRDDTGASGKLGNLVAAIGRADDRHSEARSI